MLLEWIVTLFVTAYIAVVAFGHALLFAALLKLLRENWRGARRHAVTAIDDLPCVDASKIGPI